METNDILNILPKLTPEWLAGFFDGEGCVNARMNNYGNYSVRVSITQKNITIITAILAKFPEGTYDILKHVLKGKKGYTKTVCIVWNGERAVRFLEYIKDHVVVKREQVLLALEFCSRNEKYGQSLTLENVNERRKIAHKITAINRTSLAFEPLGEESAS